MDLTLKKLFKMSNHDLLLYLKQKFKFSLSPYYVYAKGKKELPLLVCHIDTVHDSAYLENKKGLYGKYFQPPLRKKDKTVFFDSDKEVYWSPDGLGGDDRAGVYAALKLHSEFNASVLFCNYEEIGGIGASKAIGDERLVNEINKANYPFLLELDRRGSMQVVFYNNEPQPFKDLFNKYGFAEHIGSFSDISILAPFFKKNAANVSVGFHNEHTRYEYVSVRQLRKTLKHLSKMFNDIINKRLILTPDMLAYFPPLEDEFDAFDYYDFYSDYYLKGGDGEKHTE